MRTPKGTRARYPAAAEPRRAVRDRIERVLRQYGFSTISTPSLERAEVYTDKSGDDIVDELFLLDEEIGPTQLALTPELTPTVGRMVAAEQQRLTKPIKWYTTQSFWRYEEPQQGRFREFWQTNVDMFGVGEPQAEAELIELAVRSFDALGITADDLTIRISDRRVLDALIDSYNPTASSDAVMRLVDKREKLSDDEYRASLRDAGITAVDEFNAIVTTSDITVVREALGEIVDPLASLVDELTARGCGDWITVDIGTARGLDYYTGIVFEAFDTTGAVQRSLLGGGRYDSLVASYGGDEVQAVGLAFGYAPLEEALATYSRPFEDAGALDAYVVRFDETASMSDSIRSALREAGYRVDGALEGRSIGAQFGVADERGATYTIVPGPDEIDRKVVTVQRMQDGAEVEIPLSDAVEGTVRLEELSDFV